jgi:hypothetical protein
MDEVEERFIVKCFDLKERSNKKITAELQTTFHDSATFNLTVKRRIRKFKNGDVSSDDDPRADRPMAIFGPVLQKFRDRHPFSSAKVISRHFRISPPTVKEIPRRDLGLEKFSTRSVPHLVSDDRYNTEVTVHTGNGCRVYF